MWFGPILGLIRTINWNLMAFSKALKDPYPVDPNGSHGPKFALEGLLCAVQKHLKLYSNNDSNSRVEI